MQNLNLITSKIIAQAIELGFSFEQFKPDHTQNLIHVNEKLSDFFHEHSAEVPQLEDECEVKGENNTQYVIYGDFGVAGEIVDFSDHWHKSPDEKIYHSDFLKIDSDGLVKRMNLYYLVGETHLNTPESMFDEYDHI